MQIEAFINDLKKTGHTNQEISELIMYIARLVEEVRLAKIVDLLSPVDLDLLEDVKDENKLAYAYYLAYKQGYSLDYLTHLAEDTLFSKIDQDKILLDLK